MKKFLATISILLIAALPVFAFSLADGWKVLTYVADYGDADDAPIFLVKYVGTEEEGTLDINSNSFEFHIGDAGSAAAATDEAAGDVNVGDVCGSTASALDVTDSDCDTYGELVDVINANSASHGFVAVLVGALASETITIGEIVDPADVDVKTRKGVAVLGDSSESDDLTFLVAPWANQANGQDDIMPFLAGERSSQLRRGGPLLPEWVPFVSRIDTTITGSGTHALQIYALDYSAGDGTPTSTLLFSAAPSNATATTYFDDGEAPFPGYRGQALLIRANAGSALTAVILSYYGFFARPANQ